MKLAKTLLPFFLVAAALAQAPAVTDIALTPAEKLFQEDMLNVTLKGFYTQGDSSQLHEERHVIDRVTKVKDDMWKFEARIQYNKQDMKVAMSFPVKFAGETPVISLTNFTVPGFGAFNARVVLYDGTYAGTWGSSKPGSKHGGAMFGKIIKNAPAAAQ